MDHLRALRVLGIPPGSTPDEIQVAWRDLAKVWHPDRFTHDERLRQKAGETLSRINEAHEALRDYDPAKTPPMAARVRESVAMIFTPSGPIGLRHSLRVLGLGLARPTGEAGTRRSSGPGAALVVTFLLVALVLVALVVATIYWLVF